MFNDVLRNFLFKEIFKGCCLLFSYQGSCRSLSSDSLYMLPQRFAFVKNIFSSFRFLFSQLSATACLGYHISTALSTSFLTVSLCLQTRFFRSPASGCSASASPADLISCGFSSPVISDRCYLITTGRNCQRFSCFLFISDNSHNSESEHIETLLYHSPLCRIKLTIHSAPS